MSKKETITDLSVEELETMLAQKKADQRKEREEKRAAYEGEREELINTLGDFAQNVCKQMLDLKYEAFKELTAFRERLLEYGDIRGGARNKGSFEIKNDRFKIIFTNQIVKRFDERSILAEQKINEFLKTFLKKKDKETYEFISNLMKRDEESGQFDIDLINRLYKMEDSFDDVNWKEGIRLFRESYSPSNTAQYVRFAVANPNGGWDAMVLDFAKLKVAEFESEAA